MSGGELRDRPNCPFCESNNTVIAWDGDTPEGPPDYLGCFTCDADMIRLKDVRERMEEMFG